MKRMSTLFSKFLEGVITVMFSVMVVITFLQVVLRYGFSFSFSWSDELARYLMVWITFLGAALITKSREHTKVDFFASKLPTSIYKLLNIMINLGLIIFLIVLIIVNIPIFESSLTAKSIGLKIPLAYVNLALPVSGVIMIFYLLEDSIYRIKSKGEES